MKKITQNMVWISMFALTLIACGKSSVTQPVDNGTPPPPAGLPSKVEIDGEPTSLFYNANGSIDKMIHKNNTGAVTDTYLFSYENGKLKEISFGPTWKYTYNGNQISKVETYNTAGQLRYTYELTYAGDKVIEKTDYLTPAKNPQFKRVYTYGNDGNLDLVKIYQFTNGAWSESEEVQYSEYDQHENTTDQYLNYPYLPSGLFSKNNAGKEIWRSGGALEQTVVHQFTYDAGGRTKTRKSTYSSPGFPDMVTEMTLTY